MLALLAIIALVKLIVMTEKATKATVAESKMIWFCSLVTHKNKTITILTEMCVSMVHCVPPLTDRRPFTSSN